MDQYTYTAFQDEEIRLQAGPKAIINHVRSCVQDDSEWQLDVYYEQLQVYRSETWADAGYAALKTCAETINTLTEIMAEQVKLHVPAVEIYGIVLLQEKVLDASLGLVRWLKVNDAPPTNVKTEETILSALSKTRMTAQLMGLAAAMQGGL